MYLVTIENNNVETVINEISTNTNNRISGTIKQGINTINSFTFTILPNNIGYNHISPLSTLVKVLNTKTNKYEFVGRVLSLTNSMSNNGLISKTFVCESELGYLLDTYQLYEELHNVSVRGYLERLIQAHNNTTNSAKQFVVGNVNVVDNNDSLYRYIAYETTKKNIDDDLISKLGGELQVRYENNIRYLDYLTEIGNHCNTEIRLSKNLQDIEQNINFDGYCNRLIVLGAKLKGTDKEGNETDLEERLTIESVNNGLRYIDDTESIAKYGIIQGQVIYDDVTKAENLLSKGQKYLLNQRLLISNKVNALDLSLIGIDIDSFEVGNYYPLIHEILGVNDIVRVIEKSISIDNPHTTSITLGDLEKDIKKYNIQTNKKHLEVIKMTEEINKKINVVERDFSSSISKVDNTLNSVIDNINNGLIVYKGRIDKSHINYRYFSDLKLSIEIKPINGAINELYLGKNSNGYFSIYENEATEEALCSSLPTSKGVHDITQANWIDRTFEGKLDLDSDITEAINNLSNNTRIKLVGAIVNNITTEPTNVYNFLKYGL